MKTCKLRRLFAFIADVFLVGIIDIFITPIFVFNELKLDFLVFTYKFSNVDYIFIYLVYLTLFIFLNNGITPGKYAFRLKIRTKRLNDKQSLIIREVLKLFFMPIIFIQFLFFVFRLDGKALHDLITNTNIYCD